MTDVKYRCRNDFVLFELIDLGEVRGIAVPGISAQGKRRVVKAIGPGVEDLRVGDSVLVIGTMGADVVPLPNSPKLFLTKQSNVVLVEIEDLKAFEEEVDL